MNTYVTLLRLRAMISNAALFIAGVVICGNMTACVSAQIRPHLADLIPLNENFFGQIVWFDESTLPNLDFVVCTCSAREQDPYDKNIARQSYRFVRVHRDYESANSENFRRVADLLCRFFKGDPEIKALEYWGRSTCETAAMAGFAIDRTLELTALSIYDKDPALFPSSGGYPLDGVSGSVSGCPPIITKKKR